MIELAVSERRNQYQIEEMAHRRKGWCRDIKTWSHFFGVVTGHFTMCNVLVGDLKNVMAELGITLSNHVFLHNTQYVSNGYT